MITLGIVTLSMDSEQNYLTEVAKRAGDYEMECFRFVPSKIDPLSHLVKGKKFNSDTGSWIEAECPLPSLLYDRCFYGDDEHSKQCIPIVSWLKSRDDLTFLGYGLPNKLELYHALNDSVLSPYLPSSQFVSDGDLVLAELAKRTRLILKPINGSQGYGIYYLKKTQRNFHVKTEKHKQIISRIFPNEAKLMQWLRPLIKRRSYLLQPYLELSNNELQPFDIRILMQKDEHGEWTERGKGIRTGITGGLLSNLSAGGAVSSYEAWAQALPATTKEYLDSEIQYITKNLVTLLENKFLPLFELGIDLGVAKNGSIWILDVNSKPGRKVVLSTSPDLSETLYQAPVLYARYLLEAGPRERKKNHAKTLSH